MLCFASMGGWVRSVHLVRAVIVGMEAVVPQFILTNKKELFSSL